MPFTKGTPKPPGSGRKKGTRNVVPAPRVNVTPEDRATVRVIARRLVEDPTYQVGLKERLLSGELAPGVEMGLWAYAYGKPAERHLHEIESHHRVIEVITVGSSSASSSALAELPGEVIEVG